MQTFLIGIQTNTHKRHLCVYLLAACLFLFFSFFGPLSVDLVSVVQAQESRLPDLPRFAALKSDKVRLRRGPSLDHPIDWIYGRRYLPVEIFQETQNWRRVRDASGIEGWIHQSLLTQDRYVLIQSQTPQPLLSEPIPQTRTLAFLEPGVIGALRSCDVFYCRIIVSVPGTRIRHKGWISRQILWGIYPDEKP